MSPPRQPRPFDPFAGPSLGLVLDGAVHTIKRKTPDIKSYAAQLARVAKKAPEVLVKISGSGKSSGQIRAHLDYITRNGKLEAENERGEVIRGRAEVTETFEQWRLNSAHTAIKQRAQTIHIVLSMPEGTDPAAVLDAARGFAKQQFSRNHSYLMALHTDTRQPHVHLTVKAQGFDRTWLKRSKADLQQWRDRFAQKLRDQGIEAEATPRNARGVVRKAAKQPMHHLAQQPKRSTVLAAKVDHAIREIDGQVQVKDRPWERATEVRQRQVRGVYGEVEQSLRSRGDDASRKAADQLTAFLNSMPPIETEHSLFKRKLQATLHAGKDKQQSIQRQQPEAPSHDNENGRDR